MFAQNKRDDEDVQGFKDLCIQEPDMSNFKFVQPPLGINAKEFVSTHFGANSGAKHMQFRKGTTTLAFIYEPATPNDKGGVIVAVDSRATGGEYIASKTVMKLLDIGDRMVATMAGGASDCQFWIRMVAKYCTLFELREKFNITVSATSKYFANVLYGWRGQGLSVGSMICGVDKRGPAIFLVDNSGIRLSTQVCSVGSGSMYAYGVLDTHYKRKMTDEEAMKLARRAIFHATYRDIASGGYVSLVHITADEKTRYPPIDVSDLYAEYASEVGKVPYSPVDDN